MLIHKQLLDLQQCVTVLNLAVSRSSNSLRKPDREFGSASEELRRQKVPLAPGESRTIRSTSISMTSQSSRTLVMNL